MALLGAVALIGAWSSQPAATVGELKKHYWATSLTSTVDAAILQGLNAAVARGEVGWLDVDLRNAYASRAAGVNLILYHVGGNCYIGSDCDRFPASEPEGEQWGARERIINLADPAARAIVVHDLVDIVQRADKLALNGATIGVHVDNVHRLNALGLADLFNDYLKAIDTAKRQGLIAEKRAVGYIAKNNARGFKQALDQRWLHAQPLYQVQENAKLDEHGMLDYGSRLAQAIGQQYGIPVFLKTFGSDIAYTLFQDRAVWTYYVTKEMTRQMAQLPHISGAAWSSDEGRYRPMLFAQGAPARQLRPPFAE